MYTRRFLLPMECLPSLVVQLWDGREGFHLSRELSSRAVYESKHIILLVSKSLFWWDARASCEDSVLKEISGTGNQGMKQSVTTVRSDDLDLVPVMKMSNLSLKSLGGFCSELIPLVEFSHGGHAHVWSTVMWSDDSYHQYLVQLIAHCHTIFLIQMLSVFSKF